MLPLLVMGLLAAAPVPTDPGDVVRALGERYRAHLVERRPDLAWRWGVSGARARLPWFSASRLDRDAAVVSELRSALEAVDSTRLAPEPASNRRMLLARTADELSQVGPRGSLRGEPLAWTALVTDLTGALLADEGTKPCQHAQRLVPVLQGTVELWRSGAVILGRPLPSAARRDSLAAVARHLRADLPAAAGACREPQRLAAFARADSLALRSLERFTSFVLGDSGSSPAGGVAHRRAALP